MNHTYLKADTHYPYIRPVHTGGIYRPYVRVHFLTPVCTGHAFLLPVFLVRTQT